MRMQENSTDAQELEAMIDTYGLTAVLDAIHDICAAKGDHLRANWQDHVTARTWEHDAQIVNSAATKVSAS